ncbi:MAG: GNAT family N-acetyltransferase [Hyphomicrobiales bacterium]|nr:MAG: GNAT family N-acetyltransferase [Hyphomicrobiales bacterium]
MSDTLLKEAALLRDIVPGDASVCTGLSRVVGWPYRAQDWEMAIGLGHGVVGCLGSQIVATALWWPYGEDHATLGMIIVSPEHQGAGLGRRLMQALFAQAGERSLMLNATVAGKPLYERLGFVVSGGIDQHQGEVLSVAAPIPGEAATFQAARAFDLPALERLDKAATGLARGPLLREVLEHGEAVLLLRGGEAVGFSMMRQFGRGLVVGPVVAESDADARALVAYWLQGRQGQFIRIDVHTGSALSAWLEECGLTFVDRGTSMVRGTLPVAQGPGRLHALASQAFG